VDAGWSFAPSTNEKTNARAANAFGEITSMSKLWGSAAWRSSVGDGDVEAARPLAAVPLNRFSSEADSRDFADDLGDFKPSGCVGDPHAIEIDWLGRNQSASSRSPVPFLS
jgi:hypothetical protein